MEKRSRESQILASLSYFPLIGIIPLIFAKDDEFACYHAKQGLTLFILLIIVSLALIVINLIFKNFLGQIFIIGIIFKILAFLTRSIIGSIVGLLYLYLVIAGFVNAWRGRYWEIPLIKSLGDKIFKA
uniref:DUF4870 domain-containing protein n=1 Tax=candidate division WOR-3 bacterium TaxID=2052148 RepID=A0A7V3ZVA9_UNCW3